MPYAVVFSFVYFVMKLIIDTNPLLEASKNLKKLGLDIQDLRISPEMWVHWTMDKALHHHYLIPLRRTHVCDQLVELELTKFFRKYETDIGFIMRSTFDPRFLSLLTADSDYVSFLTNYGYVIKPYVPSDSFNGRKPLGIDPRLMTDEELDILFRK